MDAIDWINQITSWLLLIDAGLLLVYLAMSSEKK